MNNSTNKTTVTLSTYFIDRQTGNYYAPGEYAPGTLPERLAKELDNNYMAPKVATVTEVITAGTKEIPIITKSPEAELPQRVDIPINLQPDKLVKSVKRTKPPKVEVVE